MKITTWRVGLMMAVLGLVATVGPHPACAGLIGPDAFGYRATNDIPSTFTDITSTGTSVLAFTDDSVVADIPLGFTFNFYGTNYSTINFSTNALMQFGGIADDFVNVNLTTTSPSQDRPSIAPFWDDLQTFGGGTDAVYYQTVGTPGHRQFIAEWHQVGRYISPTAGTFEAVLSEGSNAIQFNYQNLDFSDIGNNGASATVGIRDAGGQTDGRVLQWSFNAPVLSDGESILYTIGPISAVPEPATLAPAVLAALAGAGCAWRKRRSVA
jgi:hypothetical protein